MVISASSIFCCLADWLARLRLKANREMGSLLIVGRRSSMLVLLLLLLLSVIMTFESARLGSDRRERRNETKKC